MAQDTTYLTVDKDPHGRGLLAIITRGHPQQGDKECLVLTLEVVKDMKEANDWYDRMLIEQPWLERN